MDGGSAAGHLTAPATALSARREPGPSRGPASRRSLARRELLALAVVCAWAFDLALHYGLGGSLLNWAGRHETSGIGVLPALVLTGVLGVCLIAWRRRLDGLGESRAQDRAQQPLAATHEECQSYVEGHPRVAASGVVTGRAGVAFDVRLLAGGVAALVRPAAERKGLFFKCSVGPGIPDLVHGDPARIAMVLTHLLDEAISSTQAGWVRLCVTSAHNFGEHVGIRFEVHDSGVGVLEDQERRRCLAVDELTRTAAGEHRGSGLGLVVSQEVVTSMGGVIGLSSVPDLGSAFSFTLRFALPVQGAASSSAGA